MKRLLEIALLGLLGVAPSHAAEPTDLEQYMLELVNRARADPQAEAPAFIPGGDIN